MQYETKTHKILYDAVRWSRKETKPEREAIQNHKTTNSVSECITPGMDDGEGEGGKGEGKIDTPIFETWLPPP